MNITIARNRGIITELRRISLALERANELKEIELNNVHRITTRTTAADAKDLNETQVAYNDPAYESAVRELERRSGRALNEEEAARVMAALMLDEENE